MVPLKKKARTLPDCHACRYSRGVQYTMGNGEVLPWRLYCSLTEGETYYPCPEFTYEPGTDVAELPPTWQPC